SGAWQRCHRDGIGGSSAAITGAAAPRIWRRRRREDRALVQARLGGVLRRAWHSDRARARVHGRGTRRASGGGRLGVGRTAVVAALARQTRLARPTRIDPKWGKSIPLRTGARIETLLLAMAFSVSVILGGPALLRTVSGLFGVLSYLVEQGTRRSACGSRWAP